LIRDIICIKSNKNNLEYIIDKRKNISIRDKLSDRENYFLEYDFVRIHKSILVNMRHIKQIDFPNNEARTTGGILKISRAYKKILEKKYSDYLKSQF
jgi:DNA-binding LytR/AlgR family response regulator